MSQRNLAVVMTRRRMISEATFQPRDDLRHEHVAGGVVMHLVERAGIGPQLTVGRADHPDEPAAAGDVDDGIGLTMEDQ
jgi:hypothetical protein